MTQHHDKHFFPKKSFIPHNAPFILTLAFITILLPENASAYLDPGTGSMLLSALIGIAATAFFLVKTFYYKAMGFFYQLLGGNLPIPQKQALVFYSEGKHYWNTFKPVLDALEATKNHAVYLTSDKNDPGLCASYSHITTRFIGNGNRAFAAMNILEADICVMTTPGLDVLQIRRSPGVGHYAHLVHSPTDMAIYKLFSFDYFDSVLCSGPHQIRSLRFLETLRGTAIKELFHTGCPYMDVLAQELNALDQGKPAKSSENTPRILIAPTWGTNGLLKRYGLNLLLPIVEAGCIVTIRPHPQSYISEKEILDSLLQSLTKYPNVSWDNEISALPAMYRSDVLISDLSGIIFDYAFILERPVITIAQEVDLRGLEASDLPYPAWELTKLPELGAVAQPEDAAHLPEIIAALPDKATFQKRIRTLREETLYNYRSSGAVAARQLVELHREIIASRGNP